MLRTLVRGAFLLLAASLAVPVGLVLLFRVVDPTVTSVMIQEPGPLGDLEREWVGRDAIALAAARAVMASEDQRFLDHHGIDFVSLDRAIQEFRGGAGLRGASTITQQVAKNVFLWQGRSFVRKGLEAYFALLLELCWTKERILEVYLNSAEFGPGVFGVEAAARRFFGTSAAQLSPQQAALLAAVLPNPKRLSAARPSDYVRERQRWIVGQMRVLDTRGHYRGLAW